MPNLIVTLVVLLVLRQELYWNFLFSGNGDEFSYFRMVSK